MFKFLASLLALVERVLSYFDQQRWKQEGRQETIKEMNDELNRQIQMGEAAVAVPDPERDERLRNRFDRSRAGQ